MLKLLNCHTCIYAIHHCSFYHKYYSNFQLLLTLDVRISCAYICMHDIDMYY